MEFHHHLHQLDSATTQPKKQIHVPVSSVVKEFKGAKCRLVITLKDSADDRIARSGFKQEQEESCQQNISGPSREYAILTSQQWKQKHWTPRRGNVTFPAVVKSVRTMVQAHTGKSTEIKSKQEAWMKWD